jgi:transcriptional regulator with XRE-family HTH domain
MAVREGRSVRASRRAERLLVTAGQDLRHARELAGLSIRTMEGATGISKSAWSRIERGQLRDITVRRLGVAADAAGLQLSFRLYPAGDPLRDAAQIALLERLRTRLPSTLAWRVEVPVSDADDGRAWDAVISRGRAWTPVEAETRLTDLQALERRVNLKMRDAGARAVVLLVADTRNNRAVLRAAPEAWRVGFPLGTRAALQSLAEGLLPAASALIVQ